MRTVCSILTISCLLLAVHALGFTARADGDDSDGGAPAGDAKAAEGQPAEDKAAEDKAAAAKAAEDKAAAGMARKAEATRRVALRLEALELQVAYLSSREMALTQYVLGNEARANGLETLAASMRTLGFENRKIPVDSRVALLRGLEGMALSLRKELPTLTDEQADQLKKLRALQAKAAAATVR